MTRSFPSNTPERRSGAARLVRLATTALLAVAVVVSASVCAQAASESPTAHRCIHDDVQHQVLQSVAQDYHVARDPLLAVGLPYVATVRAVATGDGAVGYLLADSTSPSVERSTEWGELRITVSTEDLTDPERYCARAGQKINNHNGLTVTCTPDDILTDEKRDMLMNSILPEAVRLHTDRLKVKQVQGTWRVTPLTYLGCGDFKVPEAHLTNGVNTDFVLYVASVPSEVDASAWALTCLAFLDDQPAVGVLNIPAAKIVSRYDQRLTRTVAHEVAHALGFSATYLELADVMDYVEGLRGMPFEHPVVKGNKTVAVARTHYGCPTLQHVEVQFDEEPFSEVLHLLTRNAKDELMAPVVGAGYYSAVTMAIFEDTGFYKADFSKAEVMTWGRNVGCDFFNEKCMENNITKWPQMFCNRTEPGLRCTSSRLEIGRCGVHAPDTPLHVYYPYFTDTAVEESSPYMEHCPYVEAEGEGACNQNTSTASDHMSAFNVFSDAARCIDGAFAPKNRSTDTRPILGMCANVQCDNTTKTYSVQVKGSSAYVNCTPGQHITLDTISDAFERNGYIICPPYAEVCQGNLKALEGRAVDSSHPRGNVAAGVHSTGTLLFGGGVTLVILLTAVLCA